MNVPQNGPAYLHQGEMVVPRTFAEDLRSGLSGAKSSGSSGGNIVVNIYNAGNVVTERDLVKSVYTGIKTMRSQGQL
jgi:hypothetical protein